MRHGHLAKKSGFGDHDRNPYHQPLGSSVDGARESHTPQSILSATSSRSFQHQQEREETDVGERGVEGQVQQWADLGSSGREIRQVQLSGNSSISVSSQHQAIKPSSGSSSGQRAGASAGGGGFSPAASGISIASMGTSDEGFPALLSPRGWPERSDVECDLEFRMDERMPDLHKRGPSKNRLMRRSNENPQVNLQVYPWPLVLYNIPIKYKWG